jgi:uncharacterized protein YjeT (DUF2065 family)
MSKLALVSIIFGTIIILTRGPIIFAPEAARKFILESIFSSNTRIRIIGIFVVVLGMIMINVAQGYDLNAALIIKYLGWYLLIVAFPILLVFTSIYKDIVINIMGNMDVLILRIIGIFGVGLGALFIYLGLDIFLS